MWSMLWTRPAAACRDRSELAGCRSLRDDGKPVIDKTDIAEFNKLYKGTMDPPKRRRRSSQCDTFGIKSRPIAYRHRFERRSRAR